MLPGSKVKALYVPIVWVQLVKNESSGVPVAVAHILVPPPIVRQYGSKLFPWSPNSAMKPWAGLTAVRRKAWRDGRRIVKCQAFQQLFHHVWTGIGQIIVFVGIGCDVKEPDVFLRRIVEGCWNEEE